ncbi:hypothetical protein RFI_17983 [Reticulomyxa filosa]|uniref:Uncharacterized protein n=1 Tax=Reticulomyxa filosa TaxID=46433 RepID=X6MZJ2_RETFI|nr:hypothetical protein RFI_17983 [Reticulomyxa filosa]|eukprot:ETO19246.1 hypothetical protein RFI_17983 [Reticulomyxa filosa]
MKKFFNIIKRQRPIQKNVGKVFFSITRKTPTISPLVSGKMGLGLRSCQAVTRVITLRRCEFGSFDPKIQVDIPNATIRDLKKTCDNLQGIFKDQASFKLEKYRNNEPEKNDFYKLTVSIIKYGASVFELQVMENLVDKKLVVREITRNVHGFHKSFISKDSSFYFHILKIILDIEKRGLAAIDEREFDRS